MEQKILIDNRKKEDIIEELNTLAKSYVPEWSLDTNKPDIGSTIALIYSSYVSDNIESINQIIDRYHAEFINLLDISVNPAIPAKSIVLMNIAQDTIEGSFVPKGTRLLSTTDEESDAVIFETAENIYVTGASIDSIIMTDRERGTIYPVYGDIFVPAVIEEKVSEDDDVTIVSDIPEIIDDGIEPFRLFGEAAGVQQNVLMLYHNCVFDVEDNDIYIQIIGNDQLISDIEQGRKYFVYAASNQLKRIEDVSLLSDNKTFCIKKSEENDKQTVDKNEYSLIAIVCDEVIEEDIDVEDIFVSSAGKADCAEYVGTERSELDTSVFDPFTDEISMYQEFYIGFDEYFKKSGAKVSVSFDLSLKERYISLSAAEVEEELKIIKKKPNTVPPPSPVDVYVQRASFEYYNGIGWKKLKTDIELSEIFSSDQKRKITFSFIAPDDWTNTVSGAYDGRMIRIQVLRADNCYYRPALHHYPHIENLKIEYTYDGRFLRPDKIKTIAGTKVFDMQDSMNKRESMKVFRTSEYVDDALYIGLTKKPVSGPVSLFFELEEGIRFDMLNCMFEYSSIDGFKPLKVADGTYSMTRSGLVIFLPPADFSMVTVEGRREYFIRMRRKEVQHKNERDINLPVINNICLNGVTVHNVETYPEQELYLDEITVGAKFNLPQEGILDIDVWVNETGVISAQAMKEMAEKYPEKCRVEYDILGNISSFFTLWEEVERFDVATHKRVYELDRLSSTIIFGNGITTDIPRVTGAVALSVKVRCCQGKQGNVDAYTIDSGYGRLFYIGDIYNPVKGYGGSDMESVDAALQRGSNIISNRRRLVSRNDYINEVLSFSDRIDKVRCLVGENYRGETEDGAISLVILMKDFSEGSYSFHEISQKLKSHIKKRCSMTISDRKLSIIEPVFVNVSVNLWVKAQRMQEAFEIQSGIINMLNDYLNPVSTLKSKGWKIGTIPTASQIQMKLNAFRNTAVIKNISVVVSYTDNEGVHEMDINELVVKKNMVCRSGNHQIYVDV